MELNWDICVFIGFIIGMWAYHGIYFVVLKTYVRKRLIKEFFDIADEMGYKIVEKDEWNRE